jgi:hypothetical protein
MDNAKCKALKAELLIQPQPQIVSAERFFEGNDDLGSIGCNLIEHPGVDAFRDVFIGLLQRPDVQDVYVQISEPDSGEDCWPFTDLVLVVGDIPANELRIVVSVLEPDEIAAAEDFGVSPSIAQRHDSSVLAVWWD